MVFASDGSLEDRGLVKPDQQQLRAARRASSTSSNEKTVLRGGYGIFYNLFDRVGSEDQLALNLPGLINNSLVSTTTTAPLFLLRSGFPAGSSPRSTSIPRPASCAPCASARSTEDAPKTTIQQASVGFQRELVAGLVRQPSTASGRRAEPGRTSST